MSSFNMSSQYENFADIECSARHFCFGFDRACLRLYYIIRIYTKQFGSRILYVLIRNCLEIYFLYLIRILRIENRILLFI